LKKRAFLRIAQSVDNLEYYVCFLEYDGEIVNRWIDHKGDIFTFDEWKEDRREYYFNSYRWAMSVIKQKFNVIKTCKLTPIPEIYKDLLVEFK
jgi:hypothetical protein